MEFQYRQLKSGWEKHVQSCFRCLGTPGIALSYTPGAIAAFEGRNGMDFLRWLFEARIPFGGSALVSHEVSTNLFGLISPFGTPTAGAPS